MTRLPRLPNSSRRVQRGVSLVELMIGITVGMFLVAGLAVLFSNTSYSRNELEKSSRMIENGRYALDALRDEIQLAGYYDVLGLPTGAAHARVDPCATTGTLGFATSPSVTVPTPLFGYNNTWVNTLESTFCTAKDSSTVHYRSGTDVLVVRHVAGGTAITPASGSTTSLYLQASACSKDSGTTPFVVAVGQSSSFTLKDKDCSTVRKVRQLVSRVFFVADCNDCTVDTTPTLKMLELQGGSLTEVALVEGVENFQVEYRLDTNGDGIADVFNVKAGSIVDSCTVSPVGYCWSNVVAADIYLLARNTDKTPSNTDTRSYLLGSNAGTDTVTIATADQVYKRHAFTTTIRLTNNAMQREVP